MPRKKRRRSTKDTLSFENFFYAIFESIAAFHIIAFRLGKAPERVPKRHIAGIVLLVVLVFALAAPFHYWIIIEVVVLPLLLAFLIGFSIRLIITHHRQKLAASGIDNHLRRALQIMDSTAKWYNNEDEANRELVTCLKSLNVDATYGYKLPNGRTADEVGCQ